jgi:predicted glycoside hydrolase/deacetylase ChbG (UPF0249 family)
VTNLFASFLSKERLKKGPWRVSRRDLQGRVLDFTRENVPYIIDRKVYLLVPHDNRIGMLIINADDFGRDGAATDCTIACHGQKSITSASAMVFMADSRRAADLAASAGLETGLHLNFTLPLDGPDIAPRIKEHHERANRYLCRGKWAQLLYDPFLHNSLEYSFKAQYEEYWRLFGKEPAQIDGHSHMHLCMNMIIGMIIPPGKKIRRSFTFRRGEKNFINRFYRRQIDKWVARHYVCTDSFFSIEPVSDQGRLRKIVQLAYTSDVELMVHPADPDQYGYLMSCEFMKLTRDIPKGNYRLLARFRRPAA